MSCEGAEISVVLIERKIQRVNGMRHLPPRYRRLDRSLVAKRGHVFAERFMPSLLTNLTDVPRTCAYVYDVRASFYDVHIPRRWSKNRTATFRESRECFSKHGVETPSRICFYLTFAHDTGCIRGESRTDYCGNTAILVSSLYAAMETFYVLRARLRFSRETAT